MIFFPKSGRPLWQKASRFLQARKEVVVLGDPRQKNTRTIAILIVHLVGGWEVNVNVFTQAFLQ